MILGDTLRRTGAIDLVEPAHSRLQVVSWQLRHRPVPAPSAAKRQMLRNAAKRYDLHFLVETGTYKGDTVRALRNDFRLIYSIELDKALYNKAIDRCQGQPNARLLQGDSSTVLPQVLSQLNGERVLFWLDAHYSGGGTAAGDMETPIIRELNLVLARAGWGVILVDDLREFENGARDYPPLAKVEALAQEHGYRCSTSDDVITLVSPKLV